MYPHCIAVFFAESLHRQRYDFSSSFFFKSNFFDNLQKSSRKIIPRSVLVNNDEY